MHWVGITYFLNGACSAAFTAIHCAWKGVVCELLDCHSAETSGSQYCHGNSRKTTINKMAPIFFLFLFLLFRNREDISPLKRTHTHSYIHTKKHISTHEKKKYLKFYIQLDSSIDQWFFKSYFKKKIFINVFLNLFHPPLFSFYSFQTLKEFFGNILR